MRVTGRDNQYVNKPNFSFSQLVDELGTVQDSAAIESIIDELLAKLQRKK